MTASKPTVDSSPGTPAAAPGPACLGPHGIATGTAPHLPDMSAAVEAAYGDDPDCFDDDGLWALADRFEAVDPATAPAREDIVEAALALFVEADLGPPQRAFAWLDYLQQTCLRLHGWADPRTCWVNVTIGRRYFRLGRYRPAADAWQLAIRAHEHHIVPRFNVGGDEVETGSVEEKLTELRIGHAVCLYALGACEHATASLLGYWRQWKQHPGDAVAGAQVSSVLMEMLRRCERRDTARTLLPDIAEHVPIGLRFGSAFTGFLATRYGTELHPRHFHAVCGYGPSRTRQTPQQRAHAATADTPSSRTNP